jgi:glutamyl-tRNA synthetase
VIRGDDHLSNTPRQILVFEALGHAVPRFAHLSMIWGADGKKLSKRHGATSVEAFHEEGILPEALLNYLALLGWSLDGETTIVSADTLKANFSLDRISKNPAIFDPEKLEWMNGMYIREMPAEQLVERMIPWLEAAGLATRGDVAARHDWFVALVPLISERVKRMTEIAPTVGFLLTEQLTLDPAAIDKALSGDEPRRSLESALEVLGALDVWETESIEAALRALPEALGIKPKIVLQAVRVALTGSTVSPPLFESVALLGRDTTLARLEQASSLIGA